MLKKLLLSVSAAAITASLYASETIVLIRHGEKPSDGLGQLSCQGLNRALKLPNVLESRFKKPDAIFAANPSKQKADKGIVYDYVRPLATIEPTAVKFGLPVNTQFGFLEVDELVNALKDKKFRNSTIFVAWEHHLLVEAAKKLAAKNPSIIVPSWANDDFDSMYIFEIDFDNNSMVFKKESQGLNNQPKECPQ